MSALKHGFPTLYLSLGALRCLLSCLKQAESLLANGVSDLESDPASQFQSISQLNALERIAQDLTRFQKLSLRSFVLVMTTMMNSQPSFEALKRFYATIYLYAHWFIPSIEVHDHCTVSQPSTLHEQNT